MMLKNFDRNCTCQILAEFEILHQRKIQVHQTRSVENSGTGISVRELRRHRNFKREGTTPCVA